MKPEANTIGWLLLISAILLFFGWFHYMMAVPGYDMFIGPLFMLFVVLIPIEMAHWGMYFLKCVPIWRSWNTGKLKWYKDKEQIMLELDKENTGK